MTFTTMEPTLSYDVMLEQSSYHKKVFWFIPRARMVQSTWHCQHHVAG